MTLPCPKGEFLHGLERALDLSKNGLDQAKTDFDNSVFTFDAITSLLRVIELLNQQPGQLEHKSITFQMSRFPTSG